MRYYKNQLYLHKCIRKILDIKDDFGTSNGFGTALGQL
jgi:hypothetical protein